MVQRHQTGFKYVISFSFMDSFADYILDILEEAVSDQEIASECPLA